MPSTTKTRKSQILIFLIALVVLAIVVLLVWHQGHRTDTALPAVTPRPGVESTAKEKKTGPIVVEKEVTAEMIQEGLNDIGQLVTEEYYFTEVVSYSSIKKLFNIQLGITASSFLASYDGVVTAGLDFTGIRILKDETDKVILVTLPKAQILHVDIDPDSFELYSEKEGLGNPISMADYNASLVELENSAREKAIKIGVVERADENARRIIRNFISGLIDPAAYSIQFTNA